MDTTGDGSRRSESPRITDVATAAEKLVRAIGAHADAVVAADEAGARAARATIGSAKSEYSWAINDAWDRVGPFPLPQTLLERESTAPRLKQIRLRVTYDLQVLDKNRLMAIAGEVSCESVPDSAEAAAALYGAQLWVPSEESGLTCPAAGYLGGFEQT